MVAVSINGNPTDGILSGASKTNLIVKPQFQEVTIKVFKGKGIKVTPKGHEMLGSTISATSLAEEYTSHVKSKTFLRKFRISPRTLSPICVCWLYPLYYGKEALYNANNKGYWHSIPAVRRFDYSNIYSSINWRMSMQSWWKETSFLAY